MLKRNLGAIAIAVSIASSAQAYWDVQNSGEDVFGNVNVTVTSSGDNGNLMRFECGSSSDPFLAFLLRDSAGEIPEIPATFVHLDQDGQKHEADAILGPWNETYVAVKVIDTAALTILAEHMKVASNSISVGITIPFMDLQVADTFSSRGSTNAGQTVMQNCF